ncbi:hypothetical protein [Microbacterium sp.]|uniref:hypothetical protein n=1 Tax=Microbacterium sp. TaxID=51671 RepID=UPI003A839D04
MTQPYPQGSVPGYAPTPAPAPRSRDTLGIVGAIVGFVPSLLSLLIQSAQRPMIEGGAISEYAAISLTVSLLAGAAGLTALALGIVSAVRRRSDRLWSGIAIGAGTVAVIGVLVNLLFYVTSAIASWL